ncbi:hypothetical protein [Streptomyces sp. NPDC058457]|uniref:hypothetical protein n=1 Tax=Streptomyces sp. NPDC058457 TaxID=3346507 RepID=UPI00365749DE
MTVRTAWLSPDGQSREDTRTNQVGALTPVTDSKGRSGVLPGSEGGLYRVTGLWLAGTDGTLNAHVTPGRAVIQSTVDRGAYPVAVTEQVDLVFAAGDAQYPRIDLVVLRVYDDTYDASGRTEAAVEIVRGTPATSPVAPTAPDVCLVLFSVTVPANAGGLTWSAAGTDLRPTTVALGGILPTRSDDTAAGGYPGHYRDINSTLQRWDGSAWVPYPKGLGGIAPAGTVTTASYTGQYRESTDGVLQRWDGSAWVPYAKATGGIAPAGAVTTGSYTGQYRDSSGGVLQRWNGSAWLPAVAPPAFVSSLDAGTTASTTYTAALTGSAVTALAVTFTVPSTGAVLVAVGARLRTAGSTTTTAFVAPQIAQGSTVVLAGNDEYAACYGGTIAGSVSTVFRYPLTPGTACTVTALYRSSDSAVTCTFDNIFVRVDPAG